MTNWSPLQANIFQFVEDPKAGNAIINAVAGSGKTTTIVEALKRVKGTSIFLAFNKSIAEELKSRGVNARTFHSLTYMPVTKSKGTHNVDVDKLKKLVKTLFSYDESRVYGLFCQKLVGLARQAGFGCLVTESKAAWEDIIDHYNLDLDNEGADMDKAIEMASYLLQMSNKSSLVDFDDLLYIAVKDNVSLPKYDFIFVDEAQDTNAIQRAILHKIMKPNSRIIAVGDPAQAIYGFRGADSNSLDLIKSEFKAVELPLSISYRCPKSVVKYAQEWVNHIQASETAHEGEVKHMNQSWTNQQFAIGDLVVCRRTAPLIKLAYSLLRDRIGVQVLGRDIGEGLKSLVRMMSTNTIDRLIDKLDKYEKREVSKFMRKEQEAKAEAIKDRVSAIMILIECLGENNRSVDALIRIIDELFADKKACVTLSTIHKAKGLEADRVFWLDYDWTATWPMAVWQRQQESNLCYVAVTRAKQVLHTLQVKDTKAK
jgi:superfamily I DNA/RNA helicase